jgi:hypothetical protein
MSEATGDLAKFEKINFIAESGVLVQYTYRLMIN